MPSQRKSVSLYCFLILKCAEALLWELYDELIAAVPAEIRVAEAITGKYWTFVRTEDGGAGLAMTLDKPTRPRTLTKNMTGMSLRELATFSKSWNFEEAALGLAAINAWWNAPERKAASLSLDIGDDDSFSFWRKRVSGKKVAVIGHFPYLENKIGDICDLSILEKRPVENDFPDSACEYLLPEQDYVFATGVTLINKTLPRLLELSRHCGIILAGPSVPLAPPLFRRGVIDLQGFVITDAAKCAAAVLGEDHSGIFGTGRRVSLTKEMLE
ncbi:MAG: DUF364 domain-containing protein [Spirochaetaceae bacterium]|jgi:uncharacterized protein (DUF4213/DUF364 family)|nr:DUF364 domain-containing protein [Spirochaetaceae bacterium]